MNPNVTNLASSIISDTRYESLKVALYEKVREWTYTSAENAFGQYMGVNRFFDELEQWSKDGIASKLKESQLKAGEIPPPDQDPDLV